MNEQCCKGMNLENFMLRKKGFSPKRSHTMWFPLYEMSRIDTNKWNCWAVSLFTFMHWRSKWQATPMFLPGESQGRRSLVGCCLWGRTESDTTEATYQQQQHAHIMSNILRKWKWQPTPVFLPGESQGWGSLVGCHLWSRTEWDMTEAT